MAEGFNVPLLGDTIELPASLGWGQICRYRLGEDIILITKQLQLSKPVIISKTAWPNSPVQPIIFHHSDSGIRQSVNGESRLLGRHTPHSIIIPSHSVPAQVYIPALVPVRVMCITVHRNWLQEFYSQTEATSPGLTRGLLNTDNFYFYESLTPPMFAIMDEILRANYPSPLLKVYLQGKVLELLALLLQKLAQQAHSKKPHRLQLREIEKVIQGEKLIRQNLSRPLTIPMLARQVALSESKLKSAFKQVFGQSIYQYIQHCRMEEAKTMLESRRYNVSEVGLLLGYTNLAHFAKAFRKQYQVLPGAYLSQLKKA
ncbi:MAG: helix-turn-helix transcriptional regulator [Microscillaceae bacterium]|nr:helix-turn-helix transcriptional regulator [Microscillaceae bacterium]